MNEMRITELRRTRGWTQERLAEESGIAVRTVQRVEGGNDASLETLSSIARALEVPVRELFGADGATLLKPDVQGLDDRTAAEQEQRDAFSRAWRSLYTGVGVALGVVVVVLIATRVWPGATILLLGVYWVVGGVVGRFLLPTVLEPWLDRRYPLSRSRRSA
jgi:transcriptional regulator with XRE-family HTH domain